MAAGKPAFASSDPSSSKSSQACRYDFARQILSPSTFQRLQSAKILIVGAGGIGCEVLKDVACAGFGHITIIDLDTIDLSNLNRQFLFNKSHIKKSKSLVAASVAGQFNPHVEILPHHGNIKESQFGYDFFNKFDVVLNALDNLDARRWVNKMCIATGVPLLESGTTGFLGQVQPIVKDLTACYDCTSKVTPKTYPVCTIRSTPSTPIHCVVWAKTWLFNQLFGEADDTEALELDKAEADGGNSEEINALRNEALEMKNLRSSLGTAGATERVFDKIFKRDIERLLRMEEMWATRAKPTPLSFDGASQTPYQEQGKGLKDQLQLGLRETFDMFDRSLQALATRSAADRSEPLSFDKDDDDALDFVTAASNLRARIYNIELKTRFDVKQVAGNIIPAIASTNAIISGALVLQAIHMLTASFTKAQDILLGRSSRLVLAGCETAKQNPECGVCVDHYVPLRVNPSQTTLSQVIQLVKTSREEGGLGVDEELELGVYEGSRLLADMDFDDNHDSTLSDLGVKVGTFLALADEDGKRRTVQLAICPLGDDAGDTALLLPPATELPDLLDRPLIKRQSDQDEEDGDDDDDVAAVEEDDGFVIDENPDLSRFAAANDRKRAAAANGREEAKKRKVTEETNANSSSDKGNDTQAANETNGQNKKRRVSGAAPNGRDDDKVIAID